MSVLGLLVKLFGIVAFRSSHSHSHGGGHGHSHGGGHGHSHGGGHGHSHGDEGHQDRNANMEGREKFVRARQNYMYHVSKESLMYMFEQLFAVGNSFYF